MEDDDVSGAIDEVDGKSDTETIGTIALGME